MALNLVVVRATLTAIQSLLEKKEYGAAAKELGQLVAVGAHESAEGYRILALHNQLREATTMPLYGNHSLTLEGDI